jgi:hypothetical protein
MSQSQLVKRLALSVLFAGDYRQMLLKRVLGFRFAALRLRHHLSGV